MRHTPPQRACTHRIKGGVYQVLQLHSARFPKFKANISALLSRKRRAKHEGKVPFLLSVQLRKLIVAEAHKKQIHAASDKIGFGHHGSTFACCSSLENVTPNGVSPRMPFRRSFRHSTSKHRKGSSRQRRFQPPRNTRWLVLLGHQRWPPVRVHRHMDLRSESSFPLPPRQ